MAQTTRGSLTSKSASKPTSSVVSAAKPAAAKMSSLSVGAAEATDSSTSTDPSAPVQVASELTLLGSSRRESDSEAAGTTQAGVANSARSVASSAATASRLELSTVPVVIQSGQPVVLEPITAVPLIITAGDEAIAGRIVATGHHGLPLTYSVVSGPTDGSTLTLDDMTGAFQYTLAADATGSTVEFTALVSETTALVAALEKLPVVGSYVPQIVTTLQQMPVVKTLLAPLIGHAKQVPVNIDASLLGDTGTTTEFAPYVDMTLYPQFDFTDAVDTGGIDHFTLGFIVSDPSDAGTPSWGGYYSMDSDWATTAFSDIYGAGADAIISFGGSANEELALVISDETDLTEAYQGVLDYYNGATADSSVDYDIASIDFDIEGTALSDTTSIATRSDAIYDLQQANDGLAVSFTLPVAPSGLTSDGLTVISDAIDAGVDISAVNLMAFDYYDTEYSPYEMGTLAIDAAEAVKGQLATLYPDKTDAELYAMISLTPMIGFADDTAEIFTLDDAQTVVSFAEQYGLARLAMWSANRDSQCGSGTSQPSNTCSGVDQTTWEFSGIFEQVQSTDAELM